MDPQMIVRLNLQYGRPSFADKTEVTDADLAAINGLKVNGPLKTLSKEDVFVRRYIILGVEPTSYMSIHPEGELNGKTINVLSELAKTLPGVPMMEAHDTGRLPWGRCFSAEVLDNQAGYAGPVLLASYFFLNDPAGVARAANIDAGIHSEGSICYSNKKAHCSICHKEMMVDVFCGMLFTQSKCDHKIGQKYDGQVAYWYPSGCVSREISSVYAGAYRKTKGRLAMAYADEEEQRGVEFLEAVLEHHNKLDEPVPPPAPVVPEVPSVTENPPAPEVPAGDTPPAVAPEQHDSPPAAPAGGGGAAPEVPHGQPDAVEPAVPGPAVSPQPPVAVKPYLVCQDCGHTVETAILGDGGDVVANFIETGCVECGGALLPADAPAQLQSLSPDVAALFGKHAGLAAAGAATPIATLKALEGPAFVFPAYDGVDVELQKRDGVVKVLVADGADLSGRFSSLAREAELLKDDNFILSGQIVRYRGNKRGTKADVQSYIESLATDDSRFRLKVTDVVVHAGADCRVKSLADRRAIVNSFPAGEHINKVKCNQVAGADQIERTVRALATRDGVVVRTGTASYSWTPAADVPAPQPPAIVAPNPAAAYALRRIDSKSGARFELALGDQVFTFLKEPNAIVGGPKTQCYASSFKDPGTTKDLDVGTFTLIRKKDGLVEVTLNGTAHTGRYVFRALPVHLALTAPWVMWKPQDQTAGAALKELCFKFQSGVFYVWEGDRADLLTVN